MRLKDLTEVDLTPGQIVLFRWFDPGVPEQSVNMTLIEEVDRKRIEESHWNGKEYDDVDYREWLVLIDGQQESWTFEFVEGEQPRDPHGCDDMWYDVYISE
jgi:hypothetical protein